MACLILSRLGAGEDIKLRVQLSCIVVHMTIKNFVQLEYFNCAMFNNYYYSRLNILITYVRRSEFDARCNVSSK